MVLSQQTTFQVSSLNISCFKRERKTIDLSDDKSTRVTIQWANSYDICQGFLEWPIKVTYFTIKTALSVKMFDFVKEYRDKNWPTSMEKEVTISRFKIKSGERQPKDHGEWCYIEDHLPGQADLAWCHHELQYTH